MGADVTSGPIGPPTGHRHPPEALRSARRAQPEAVRVDGGRRRYGS